MWAINELTNFSEVDRFIMSSELLITPAQWFDVTLRGGMDANTDHRITNYPVSSASNSGFGTCEEALQRIGNERRHHWPDF